MNKDSKVEKDNILFKELRKLINILFQLGDCGINEYIKFPRICSVGAIYSGKSSVLESILGLDFIPCGEGVVTRRPIEIKLNHINSGESWAVFEERKTKKFTDFIQVKEKIEELIDEVCRNGNDIHDKPLILNIYSQIYPDITFIDLPGIKHIPLGMVPKNIELISRDIAIRYIEDPLTIILCVINANGDMYTSEGLRIAKEIDKTGSRTIGIITKLDIMDAGLDARKEILNEVVPLKLGYVGVRNRSKNDRMKKLSMSESLKKEKDFFKSHPAYKSLSSNLLGREALINKLTKLYFRMMGPSIQKIINSINDKIKQAEEELHNLGTDLSTNNEGKMTLLWNMIKEYCDLFKKILQGKYNDKLHFLDGEGGYKIKILLKKLLEEFTGDYKATTEYTDEKINYVLTVHEGSMPGFPSLDAFIYLLRPHLEKLKEPIEDCFSNIFEYLEFLSKKILEKVFAKFPNIINDINDLVSSYLIEERNKTKYLLDSFVDMEINYFFTNDYEYLNNFNTYKSKSLNQIYNNNNMSNNIQGSNDTKQNINEIKPQIQMNNRNIFIKEIRNRIDAYFKLIVRNLRESIPKIIGKFLVQEIRDNIQLKLYNKLYNSTLMSNSFNETENDSERKKELNEMIKILKNALKEIKRDPYFMDNILINSNFI